QQPTVGQARRALARPRRPARGHGLSRLRLGGGRGRAGLQGRSQAALGCQPSERGAERERRRGGRERPVSHGVVFLRGVRGDSAAILLSRHARFQMVVPVTCLECLEGMPVEDVVIGLINQISPDSLLSWVARGGIFKPSSRCLAAAILTELRRAYTVV